MIPHLALQLIRGLVAIGVFVVVVAGLGFIFYTMEARYERRIREASGR